MRGRDGLTFAVGFLHLCLLASVLESHRHVLVVKEKWSSVAANKTLRIEFNELAVRNVRTLLVQRGRRDHNTVQWKEFFENRKRKVKVKTRLFNNKHLDVQREPVWELHYDCFMLIERNTVHVAVYDFKHTLISDSYTVKLPAAAVPTYEVTPDIDSKLFVVDMEAGQKVVTRLCYKNQPVCNGILCHQINTDVNRTVTFNLPYLVPCLCVQLFYDARSDAKRHTTCPLEDKILPGGGELLSSSSLQLFGSSVLQWNHLCPSTQFNPNVSLCWQSTRNHSQCVSVQNSTLHMSNMKYNVSDVDKHAHMCLKFSLNESCRVFCPFSSADLSEWNVTVFPGSWRLHLRVSSNSPASFSAQLCVEKGESCVMKERVYTVQIVWRSDPALQGRRIICPDYTHRRWGLIVATSLALLVTVTTVCILAYNLIKQQTSVWRSAERKPVLLVCSSDETSHFSAVCALACGLQEELHMDVRLAQWAHCSTLTSLAQLGPAPWLHGQCQQVHSLGGMVLIVWSPKAQQTFRRWRETEGGGNVGQKDKVPLKQWSNNQSWAESQSSITAPVFNASLINMWAGLQSERHGQGFGLVYFRGLCGTRCIPKELRGIRRYCLPKNLSNLIHELNVNVQGQRSRIENESSWCCLPRLFSKGLSFWLSQRLARRLDAWLPRTTPKPDGKRLLKISSKVAKEKKLQKRYCLECHVTPPVHLCAGRDPSLIRTAKESTCRHAALCHRVTHCLSHLRLVMMLLLLGLTLTVWTTLAHTQALELFNFTKENALTCSQSTVKLILKLGNVCCVLILLGDICVYYEEQVYVSGLSAHALLCSSHQGLRPCLRIQINITTTEIHEETGLSGENGFHDKRGKNGSNKHGNNLDSSAPSSISVQVCYQGPDFSGSKELTFTLASSDDQMWMSLIVELRKSDFGSTVTVFCLNIDNPSFTKDLIMPTTNEVCSQGLAIGWCRAPILYPQINPKTGMAEIRVGDPYNDDVQDLQACQMMEQDGPCLRLDWLLTNDDGAVKNSTALVWNITAPCRLEADIHLCRKTSGLSNCHRTDDSRHHTHSRPNPKWNLNDNLHWIKVKGIAGHFDPVCPFESRVGDGQVVLLYPPDADSAVAVLVCHLGSTLSSLGFGVSLELWSREELNALGPVPWLHSRLHRIQCHGGKVVLVLTPAAWTRAEEWCQSRGEKTERRENCSDVFSASLSCILADYLQGRAGERFALVQFETQPAEPSIERGSMPELFRGLPLFILPSQSLGFLTEITHRAYKGQKEKERSESRRTRASGLRAGARILAGTLRELTGGTGYKLAEVSHDRIGLQVDDPWVTIPLTLEHPTPPASPVK
ncbi:Interleukin-17 receptor E [Bagarius yarrelli]|uniref:Interleukin-17 receptor E n=1 Tax=Bagarius yarrelli TaxID=175774 RepID=A0A556U1Y6_BAGYA|nr:Interleukin-17 receptor E [Bagarius yarrelli]